jgi:hypothetical protein
MKATKLFYLLTTLLTSFFYNTAYGQFPYPDKDDASLVLSKTLAVELLDGKENEYLNNSLIQIFKDNWSYTDVVFLTSTEIEKAFTDKNESYAYLFQSNNIVTHGRTSSSYVDQFGRKTFNSIGSKEIKTDYIAFTFENFPFELKVLENGKTKNITNITFANSELTKIDYIFLVQQLNRLISFASEGKNSSEYYNDVEVNIEKIKAKKLLILSDFFTEKDLKKMASFYDYDHEVVEYIRYEDAIIDHEKNSMYIKIIWNHFAGVYIWIVVDSESGQILAQTSFGGVKFGRHHTANDIIKAKHLSYSTSKFAQKINTRHYR